MPTRLDCTCGQGTGRVPAAPISTAFSWSKAYPSQVLDFTTDPSSRTSLDDIIYPIQDKPNSKIQIRVNHPNQDGKRMGHTCCHGSESSWLSSFWIACTKGPWSCFFSWHFPLMIPSLHLLFQEGSGPFWICCHFPLSGNQGCIAITKFAATPLLAAKRFGQRHVWEAGNTPQ